MPSSNEKLAAALSELQTLQGNGARVFASSQLGRLARERLVKHGFLHEVMRGWLISASPGVRTGDTTPWFSSFWEFCARYSDHRFRGEWHVSPEQSLLLHAANSTVPRQVIIHSPHANNNRVELPSQTSLFALKSRSLPAADDLERTSEGLVVFTLAAALTRSSETIFVHHALEVRSALGTIRDPSELLARLLSGSHSVVAGRLAGALRSIGNAAVADEILAVMKAADYDVRESNPFVDAAPAIVARTAPALVARLEGLWDLGRDAVLAVFPDPPGLPEREQYLAAVEHAYRLDAYHSLSIEGYQVSDELVRRVATGAWDLRDGSDRESRDALAARGYWQAFQKVQATVGEVIASQGSVTGLRAAHRAWYRELFNPHVAAGLLDAAVLAGYRTAPVYIRGSRHLPPRSDTLRDAMPALFDLIERESHPAVRGVLGHWLLGYVHPFPDGNGRIARFLMNAAFASGGYPWTIVRTEQRDEYLTGLERASVDNDVEPLARFLVEQMQRRP